MQFFPSVKKKIDGAVNYKGRADSGRFTGKFPTEYKGIVSPGNDAVGYFQIRSGVLKMADFCIPDLFVWYPEAEFQQMYPLGVPPCKWCGCNSKCVMRYSWMPAPRRGHSSTRNTAIFSRIYYCKTRKSNGIKPYFFSGIDNSPDYVKMRWRMDGFDISHRSAISLSLLRQLRAAIIQGLSVSGYRETLIQQLRERHLMVAVQWRAYVDYIRKNPPLFGRPTREEMDLMHQDFADFDSELYDQHIPSTSWLIQRVMLLMEADNEYKARRMQMRDGQHISADHSFKLTKCITSGGSKPFTAVYCLMNQYGQVVAWWFTTGTSLTELECAISKIKHRYKLYGYDGPTFVTTDNCCNERSFWYRTFGFANRPIEHQYLAEEDISEIEVVASPSRAQIASTLAVCDIFVGLIDEQLAKHPVEQQVIIVDGEWRVGNSRMDLLIVCLPFSEYKVYLFQLSKMCNNDTAKFPHTLKTLLEDPTIKKVGNRINCDVAKLKGWGVDLQATVELGHIMFDRLLVPNRMPSLATIVDTLFSGVELEGKDGDNSARVSDWSAGSLSPEQIKYALNDGYATGVSYRRAMQIMNPKVQGRLLVQDVSDGLSVTIYTNDWKCKVADGILRGRAAQRNKVNVEIDLSDDAVFAPGVIVDTLDSNGESVRKSLTSLQENVNIHDDTTSRVIIQWPIYFCRRPINMSGSESTITINTERRQVLVDFDLQTHVQIQSTGNNDESDLDDSSSSLSDGGNDLVTSLPRNIRRRKNYFRGERCKNDIVHLFFRFQHVWKKSHGAYFSFMTALRDAFYIVNQDDLDQCCQTLRDSHGLTEEQICQKMKYDYDWFLKRVRRHVPDPLVLERRYMEVFRQYKDVCCAKTGDKLFCTRESYACHKAAIKHIRRNCISDIPFESYYSPIRSDKHGLTVNHCHRGTPGNEGLHQKMRQLVRGFSTSPRFMFCMLTDFFLAWNQKIDIRIRGLSKKYDGLYCGDLLEDEIEKMSAWRQRDSPPHPEWVSTRSVESTGEAFGFLTNDSNQINSADGNLSDESICIDAYAVEDELQDLEDGTNELEASLARQLPASSLWMANLHGKFRPYGRVIGNAEWEYFTANLSKFQGRTPDEADNHCSIRFSDFAESWNKWVDSLGVREPAVTYKTAAYLKDAFKSMKRRAVQSSTLRPHKHTLDELKTKHTCEESNRDFLGDMPALEKAPANWPMQQTTHTTTLANQDEIEIPVQQNLADEQDYLADNSENDTDSPRRRRRKKRRKNSQLRCRRCGKEYASPEWKEKHINNKPREEDWSGKRASSRHLRNGPNNRVWDHCIVDPVDFEPDFPVLDMSKRLPKRKREKQSIS